MGPNIGRRATFVWWAANSGPRELSCCTTMASGAPSVTTAGMTPTLTLCVVSGDSVAQLGLRSRWSSGAEEGVGCGSPRSGAMARNNGSWIVTSWAGARI